VRQSLPQCAQDRQPSGPRIEDADRWIHAAQSSEPWRPVCL
jgi:hypothetical protein